MFRRLAAEQVSLSAEQVSLDSTFAGDLDFDSLDQVEFMMEIEDAFNVSVPDDAVERILTVRQAVDEVRRLTESRNLAT
ncbi:MAG TPA: acyl carrier protein [Sedimentisphaerales bacterium]|nr:acyl carrier protein [Sedimentisphaerales bacterium]